MPQSIGQAVRKALADSKVNVAGPSGTEWSALAKARLKAAGADSESAFMRGALLLGVERHDDLIHFMPHKNRGSSGKERGFHALAEYSVTVAASSDDASIGTACVEALSRCQ